MTQTTEQRIAEANAQLCSNNGCESKEHTFKWTAENINLWRSDKEIEAIGNYKHSNE